MFRSLMVNEPVPSPPPAASHRRLKQGMVGLTALGLAGWLFRKK